MIIFVSKSDCQECRLLYPKFVAASQICDPDEARFGRIEHAGLASQYDVETFPSLLYFKANSKRVERVRIDVTVESILKFIGVVIKKDFLYMNVHYTVELNQANFNEILDTPRQFKMLLLYSNADKDQVEWFDDVAEIYKNDDKVIFCRLNVDLEGNLRGRFKAKSFPQLYWYTDDEMPDKLMYGGRYDKMELTSFINDKTGIQRSPEDGSLKEGAGTLKDFDDLIRENKNTIAKGKDMLQVIKKARNLVDNYEDKQMAEYYLYLLEEIEYHGDTSIIDDEKYYLIRELMNEHGPKEHEMYLKKQNVVRQFFNLLGDKLVQRNSKESPFVLAKEPRPHKHSLKKIHAHEEL